MELMIPIGEGTTGAYSYDYYARIPVKQFTDKTLILRGDVPEAFMNEVTNAPFLAYEPLRRPSIHLTAERGWLNVIFEVTANYGIILGVFELPEAPLEFVTDTEQFELFRVYQIT